MKKYKEKLRAVSASRIDEMTQLRSSQVEAFCNLISALTFWEQTIREIALAELEEESCNDMDSQAQRRARALVQQSRDNCMNAWQCAKDGMRRFELIRWESVIISVFGTVGGVALGIFLGWAVVKSASSTTLGVFAAPPQQLVIFLIAGALAGLRPARRASRLDVLTAISAP